MRRSRALLLGLALLALPGPAGGQDRRAEPQRPIGTFSERTAVNWVLVPVGVRDDAGWVADLRRRDFRLFVDGRRVAFPDFEAGVEAPVSLVLLQDLSGSMANGGKLDASRRFLGHLLAAARSADELALATFAGGRLTVEVPFTREESVLAEAMALWRGYGTTAIHDAVAWIPDIAFEGRHGRRAVVLVTDGVDNASAIAPEVARGIVRRARLPVYVLGLGRDEPPPPGGDTYGDLLRRLAAASGGGYFPVARPEEANGVAGRLLDELRHQYVLAFPAAPEPVVERVLRVTVREAGTTVYHRRAYYGGPPL
jgi:Ca-activated chloride channel family protein